MQPEFPPSRDLVLVGGGHSHVVVLRQLGMRPVPGLRVTLISDTTSAPYSGMLPGLIAGHYRTDNCFIDLHRLCRWAGCRLFRSRAVHLDTANRRIHCDNRPPVRYDWLSLNLGSTPDLSTLAGGGAGGAAVKPIQSFQTRLETWMTGLGSAPQSLAVVGGGAAGVELALAIDHALRQRDQRQGVDLQLISTSEEILPSHNARVQRYFRRELAHRGIGLLLGHQVTGSSPGWLQLAGRTDLATDFAVWALPAGPPDWLRDAGLELDHRGFVAVDHTLRSRSHPAIFAAGDCIAWHPRALPRSGVYAVRQGPVLAANLRRAIAGQPLRPYRPQARFLSLLATGDRRAVASRGRFSAHGAWVWHWKDRIDSAFMRRFRVLPAAGMPRTARGANASREIAEGAMRCGGCGAKVGSDVLQGVLAALPGADTAAGIEDAAVIIPPGDDRLLLQTVDHFRAFVDDPFLFGAIAANHCLGDIYAMGGRPVSALALANVPYSHPRIAGDTLLQLMRGALTTLDAANTRLLGGHSSEAAELAFGLTVNGEVAADALLGKRGLRPGDHLVLTKALGTGTLLAAHMRHRARAPWLDQALEQMLLSNARAAIIVAEHGARACTDITGFGLLGHLLEMLADGSWEVILELDALPLLPGAESCLARGITSSLHPANVAQRRVLTPASRGLGSPRELALYDPQTAGGLLAGIPAEHLDACLRALREAGYTAAAVGRVEGGPAHREVPAVTLV